MTILEKHFQFVNEQLNFHRQRALVYSEVPFRRKKHLETAEKFEALLNDIKAASDILEKAAAQKPIEHPKQLRLSLRPGDVEGLPEELLNELSISSADKAEFAILSILEEAGGIMSLDQIIVGLYLETGEIHKRSAVTNRLYRMAQKGLIHSVSGKKGVYSLKPLSENEAEGILADSN